MATTLEHKIHLFGCGVTDLKPLSMLKRCEISALSSLAEGLTSLIVLAELHGKIDKSASGSPLPSHSPSQRIARAYEQLFEL